MLIGYENGKTYSFEDGYILVDGSKFGFLMTTDEGEKMIVCHPRRVGLRGKEYGFYIPHALLVRSQRSFLFEVKNRKGKYTHYILRTDQKQRMFVGPDDVFVSIARMDVNLDAAHIVRLRRKT